MRMAPGYRSACWLAAGLVAAAAASAWAQPPRMALIEAVRAGDAGAVEALIEAGADVRATEPDGTAALHWAAHNDDLRLVSELSWRPAPRRTPPPATASRPSPSPPPTAAPRRCDCYSKPVPTPTARRARARPR